MAKQIVTLYVDDTSLRLMVTDGKQIKEWAELPLESGLIEGNVVINESEFTAKVKQLFEAQKVKTKKINVGVSGLRCLTRPITLPQLPDEMLDEAVMREARSVLPLPLEEVYISWQTVPAPEEKTQVFLVAIPRNTADALLKALNQAGLKPIFLDIKPMLLARVVREATAVVVDVQTTEFDIIVLADGIPQPIRSISFASEALSWEEKLTTIRNELDRTISFYNSNNPEKPLDSSVPIFASGDLANESELCQTLSDQLGHPVPSLSPPLECPGEFDPSRYMVNIGLALEKLPTGEEAGSSVTNLSPVPAPYLPKPISLTNILGAVGAVIAAVLLASMVYLTIFAPPDIASINAELVATEQDYQQRLAQRQELKGNVAELQTEIAEVEASRESFTAVLGILETQTVGINGHLEVTIKSLPDTISLSSISHADDILTISGWAPSEAGVLSYLMGLDASGRFGEVAITNMTRIESGGMDFTLLGSLQTESDRASIIEVVLSSLPTTISLTSVSSTNGTLTIAGRSPDEDEVLSYLRDLEPSGIFSELTITSMTRNEEGGMDFSLVLKTGE